MRCRTAGRRASNGRGCPASCSRWLPSPIIRAPVPRPIPGRCVTATCCHAGPLRCRCLRASALDASLDRLLLGRYAITSGMLAWNDAVPACKVLYAPIDLGSPVREYGCASYCAEAVFGTSLPEWWRSTGLAWGRCQRGWTRPRHEALLFGGGISGLLAFRVSV